MSQLSDFYRNAYPKAYIAWVRSSGILPIENFIHLDKEPDFWRCRFCGKAVDYDKALCPGCGAHEGE